MWCTLQKFCVGTSSHTTSERLTLVTMHRLYQSKGGTRFFFLQTRIAIPQYFSQSYGAYIKYIVRTCTCAYTYCKCLRDVNDILCHIKIRAIWLTEMQSSFAETKIAGGTGLYRWGRVNERLRKDCVHGAPPNHLVYRYTLKTNLINVQFNPTL